MKVWVVVVKVESHLGELWMMITHPHPAYIIYLRLYTNTSPKKTSVVEAFDYIKSSCCVYSLKISLCHVQCSNLSYVLVHMDRRTRAPIYSITVTVLICHGTAYNKYIATWLVLAFVRLTLSYVLTWIQFWLSTDIHIVVYINNLTFDTWTACLEFCIIKFGSICFKSVQYNLSEICLLSILSLNDEFTVSLWCRNHKLKHWWISK